MKKRFSYCFIAFCIADSILLLTGTTVLSQSLYPEGLLNQKGSFSRGATTALGGPFRGVATAAGITKGLYPIRSTGVSTFPSTACSSVGRMTRTSARVASRRAGSPHRKRRTSTPRWSCRGYCLPCAKTGVRSKRRSAVSYPKSSSALTYEAISTCIPPGRTARCRSRRCSRPA